MCGSDVRANEYTPKQASTAGTSGANYQSEGPVKALSFGGEMSMPAEEEKDPTKVTLDP